MTIKAKQTVVEIISILFIILFVYAAVSKLMDFSHFKVQLGQSPIITDFSTWLIWFVPALEIGISILLLLPHSRQAGLYLSLSLMTLFSGYIVLITHFSPFTPCSCGGVLQNMTWNQHLVFNIFFMVFATTGILLESDISINTKHLLQ